ncbi:MAG: pyridoxal-phosphate dependent enzyme [Anaerolineae bacterium]|nr:pyridoxal-phosphate dependent enzyme [Anaerolineae bacterium]
MTTQVKISNTRVIFSSNGIESAIGNTPLIKLNRVTSHLSPFVQVYAKAEWFNPGGSVKSRPALNIIHTAMKDGSLIPGKRLLDSTSGNMGIAYATFGASMGIPVTLTMPANVSSERISILKALGAELILTDALEGSDGAMRVAQNMALENPSRYFYAHQYNNPANWQAHYFGTGPEIISQTDGLVTHFVAGLGTTGTLMGVGRYLHEYNPTIQVIAVQPDSPFHGLEGLKHLPSSEKPGIFEPSLVDRELTTITEDAYQMVARLAREEGIFVGISSGAAATAAIDLASHLDEGVVVTIFPDAGYKYLSDSHLWEN